MNRNDKNATRAGRSIDNLDDRKNSVPTDPGQGSPHGRRMPHYSDEILEDEKNAALDHVQVSAVGDVAENGKIVATGDPQKRPRK
jgi:hypothetical protein